MTELLIRLQMDMRDTEPSKELAHEDRLRRWDVVVLASADEAASALFPLWRRGWSTDPWTINQRRIIEELSTLSTPLAVKRR